MSDVEQQARSLGWVPLEEFKSGADKFISAEEFLERGQNIMPILKSNNKKLESQLHAQSAELERMKSMFNASQESIAELQKVHAEATKQAVEKARKDLRAQLIEAREAGDTALQVDLEEQIDELKTIEKKTKAAPAPAAAAAANPQLHPDFGPWMAENPWFGADQRKTLRAMGIAQELRADPQYDALQGRAYFDKILEVMEERTSGTSRTSKVGESRSSGGGSGSGKRGFNDLPQEAKDACERQGKKLIGEGRAFKDQAAWRDYYTNLYYQGEA